MEEQPADIHAAIPQVKVREGRAAGNKDFYIDAFLHVTLRQLADREANAAANYVTYERVLTQP